MQCKYFTDQHRDDAASSCPAGLPCQVAQKFDVLETLISDRERDGCPRDHRHPAMLASVKADLYRFQHLVEVDR
jgi:hypothetical protein